jgi:DAK2 domain fusion protein YloV
MTRRAGDGAALLAAYRAAVSNLASHVDEVNALNVFPVPDGDTGSNMLATVKAALTEAEAVVDPSADRIAAAISFGALMGARGNSGVIASQIFRGMADGLGGKQHFTGPDLAHALTQGTATAYKAVGKPVEGTILTVIREAAASAVESAENGGDLEDVLTAAVEGARQAVARTPSMLPILREAGVVDAGGQGLYRLLEGSLGYLLARERMATPAVAPLDAAARVAPQRESADRPEMDDGFGYETMFMLQSRNGAIDIDRLKADLEAIGESVLVAGDSRTVKVHVHNERPDEAIALGLTLGSLTRITVENLDAQSHEVREKRAAEMVGSPIDRAAPVHHGKRLHVEPGTYEAQAASALVGGVSETSHSNGTESARVVVSGGAVATKVPPLAVVAVAAGDGLARIFASYGVAEVVHGGQSNNPSTGELLDAVERVTAEEILLLPNNPNVLLAARQAAEMTHRRVRVVPTRNAAEGFAALLALDPESDATVNAEVMTLAGRAIQTLQVTEAVRDATIGGRKVKVGQTIALDPDDGLLAVSPDRLKAVVSALEALEPGFELITIYYGGTADLAEAETVAHRISQWRPSVEVEVVHGGQPHYRYLISAE